MCQFGHPVGGGAEIEEIKCKPSEGVVWHAKLKTELCGLGFGLACSAGSTGIVGGGVYAVVKVVGAVAREPADKYK
jgi:hypothetical protein